MALKRQTCAICIPQIQLTLMASTLRMTQLIKHAGISSYRTVQGASAFKNRASKRNRIKQTCEITHSSNTYYLQIKLCQDGESVPKQADRMPVVLLNTGGMPNHVCKQLAGSSSYAHSSYTQNRCWVSMYCHFKTEGTIPRTGGMRLGVPPVIRIATQAWLARIGIPFHVAFPRTYSTKEWKAVQCTSEEWPSYQKLAQNI